MSTLGIVGWDKPAVVIQQSATVAKDEALAGARAIVSIESDFDADMAAGTLREMKGLINGCERARSDVKAPVIELGRKIDATAKAYSQEIQLEVDRVGGLVAAYHEEKRQKALKEQQARQAELDRIEREKREAEEKLRKEAEAALLKAESPEAAAQVAESADKAADNLQKQSATQVRAVTASRVAAPPKLAGVSVVPVWKFEVVDIHALHAARPDLVELKPRTSEINAAIAGGVEIPGLRVWKENTTRIRA